MDTALYSELSWLPRPPQDFNEQCRAAEKAPEGLGLRVRSLAAFGLDANQLVRLARELEKARSAGWSLAPLLPYKLGLITNATSDFITSALTATGARHRLALECISAGYDQAVQESLDPNSSLHRSAPDGVLIALDWRGLPLIPTPGEAERATETVRNALNHLRMIA